MNQKSGISIAKITVSSKAPIQKDLNFYFRADRDPIHRILVDNASAQALERFLMNDVDDAVLSIAAADFKTVETAFPPDEAEAKVDLKI